jgi:hypothetical protein
MGAAECRTGGCMYVSSCFSPGSKSACTMPSGMCFATCINPDVPKYRCYDGYLLLATILAYNATMLHMYTSPCIIQL